jgi:amino acid adenylation domain-containing protein
VAGLIHLRAVARPDASAVSATNRRLSYRELDVWTDRLAGHLCRLGVGRNVLVGLCLDRSIEFVVGALGILKAGGAYVPMDPDYPTDRLEFMLTDTRAGVLIADRSTAARLPPGGWRVIQVDEALDDRASPGVVAVTTPSDLAYVIFTSGSTGRPKGVEITHGGLLNLVAWHQREFGVSAADRATQLASPGFDAAVWEVWPYLTSGASVHIPDEETRLSPERLRDWLVAEAITISFLPTPLAEAAMTLEWPPETRLRRLLTGGDVLRHYPPAGLPFKVINNYGPTENTVVATSGEVPPLASTGRLPCIGSPISNVQVHILDESLQPVPLGAVGELHIGGAGLARGYLNRPELTAEKFVAHALGERLYKTGDLGRYLPDGSIEFLGRVDDQIKIRGFRVETGEIEAVLAEHPSVQTSVVVAHGDASMDKRLVAYVVPRPGLNPSDLDLRGFLATKLPDYMLPAAFIRLVTLPLTPNGKIDRAALPDPVACFANGNAAFVAPRTAVEERLADIVADLLGVDQVGMEDNFFLLGGHSLLGAQVIVQVQDTFDVELSLQTLFTAPTLAALSTEIESLIFEKVEAMSEEEALALVQP